MKRIIAMGIVLAMTLSLAACGNTDGESSGGDSDMPTTIAAQADPANAGEAAEEDNRKLSFYSKDSAGELICMTEYRCGKDYALATDEFIFYFKSDSESENGTGIAYYLDTADKTGFEATGYDAAFLSMSFFVLNLYAAVFDFTGFRELGAEKIGSETFLGRNAEVYRLEYKGVLYQFWVDEATGCTLKRATVNEAGEGIEVDGAAFKFIVYDEPSALPAVMEVVEFVEGGVTLEGVVNLEEYKILPELDENASFRDLLNYAVMSGELEGLEDYSDTGIGRILNNYMSGKGLLRSVLGEIFS